MGNKRKEISPKAATALLVKVHRRCCICHRFCGLKLELHHIVDAQNNDIDNAIPLCFECHAEVALYNPKHPKGRKYTADELKQHRDQWVELCKTSAAFLASVPMIVDVGPLEGLMNELEFNRPLTNVSASDDLGPLFETRQFDRCLLEGVFILIEEEVKNSLFSLYKKLKDANHSITQRSNVIASADTRVRKRFDKVPVTKIKALKDEFESTLKLLNKYLHSDIGVAR